MVPGHYLLVIGDVHGRMEEYVYATSRAHASIQLGDLGFDYCRLSQVDARRHRIVAGNHDNYTGEVVSAQLVNQLPRRVPGERYTVNSAGDVVRLTLQTAHFLGDFGTWSVPGYEGRSGQGEIFFCRGERSSDKADHSEGVDWFAEEELTNDRLTEAIAHYRATRPQFVVTHTAPTSLYRQIAPGSTWMPSRTSEALQRMLDWHRPLYWLFGHFHIGWGKKIQGTLFLCLDELRCAGFDRQMQLQPPIEDARSWYAWRTPTTQHNATS